MRGEEREDLRGVAIGACGAEVVLERQQPLDVLEALCRGQLFEEPLEVSVRLELIGSGGADETAERSARLRTAHRISEEPVGGGTRGVWRSMSEYPPPSYASTEAPGARSAAELAPPSAPRSCELRQRQKS